MIAAAAEGQEALLHEPWAILVAIFTTSLAGILGGIAAIIAARRSKSAKDMASAIAAAMEQNIGTANGHGSLMSQTNRLMQNQHDIMQTQAKDSSALTEHITTADMRLDRIHERVSRIDDRLEGHVAESAVYRAGIENTIGALADRLREHDEWERLQKYNQPWDGTDRRVTGPHEVPAERRSRRKGRPGTPEP